MYSAVATSKLSVLLLGTRMQQGTKWARLCFKALTSGSAEGGVLRMECPGATQPDANLSSISQQRFDLEQGLVL